MTSLVSSAKSAEAYNPASALTSSGLTQDVSKDARPVKAVSPLVSQRISVSHPRRYSRSFQVKADKILLLLKKKYPAPKIALRSANSFQLLVATILSAQCTDTRVNIVTEALFKKYRRLEDYARADLKVFQNDIRSTGFYRHKAKNIISAAGKILKDFKGSVPQTMEELITLPGVARKTANVVLYNAFGKNEGIAVDTHVARVSQRLALTRQSDPVKIEKDLMRIVENKKEWGELSLRFIWHGRQTCMARSPQCPVCVLKDLCPSRKIFFPDL